jgi:nitrite reductase/ring-hydroxylating ferredoxin subunit
MLHRICDTKDITEGRMSVFGIEGKDILVGRKNGKLFAFDKGSFIIKGST